MNDIKDAAIDAILQQGEFLQQDLAADFAAKWRNPDIGPSALGMESQYRPGVQKSHPTWTDQIRNTM